MIYLIESSGFDKTRTNLIRLLKIGYTEDSNKNGRFAQYKLHNPTCRVLYTIPRGNDLEERGIQQKFRSYRYPEYGREWFMWNQEIIDFFDIHKTKESLSEFSKIIPPSTSEITSAVNRVVSELNNRGEIKLTDLLNKNTEIVRDIKQNIKPINYDYLLDVLEDTYKVDLHKKIILSDEASKVMEKFNSLTHNFVDRMKYLAEFYKDITDESLKKELLDEIPIVFEFYLLTIGPKRILEIGGQKSKLEKEYQRIKLNRRHSDSLRKEIYSNFTVGKRYLLSNIKSTLDSIYSKVGIDLVPKASDLDNYFDIKDCLITNKVTGKRDHAFKILGIKK